MERLFSYGTLQLEAVQRETFGRLLQGQRDVLPGYVIGEVTIRDQDVIRKSGRDRHPILRHTGNPADEVAGTVFEISREELRRADAYEVEDYVRIEALFRSGQRAWVYAAASDAGSA